MTTFFDEVNERRHELLTSWVSRIFLMGNTARMLRGIKAATVRKLLHDAMGDCGALAKCNSQRSFDRLWSRYVSKLERTRHVRFGQAAKLVNLYVKAAAADRDLLRTRQAERIRKWAHCPIDSRILTRLLLDFPDKMRGIKIRRAIPLKDISENQYRQIQEFLRKDAARARRIALDYDLAYVDGKPSSVQD
jgi:hypothetical protein